MNQGGGGAGGTNFGKAHRVGFGPRFLTNHGSDDESDPAEEIDPSIESYRLFGIWKRFAALKFLTLRNLLRPFR